MNNTDTLLSLILEEVKALRNDIQMIKQDVVGPIQNKSVVASFVPKISEDFKNNIVLTLLPKPDCEEWLINWFVSEAQYSRDDVLGLQKGCIEYDSIKKKISDYFNDRRSHTKNNYILPFLNERFQQNPAQYFQNVLEDTTMENHSELLEAVYLHVISQSYFRGSGAKGLTNESRSFLWTLIKEISFDSQKQATTKRKRSGPINYSPYKKQKENEMILESMKVPDPPTEQPPHLHELQGVQPVQVQSVPVQPVHPQVQQIHPQV